MKFMHLSKDISEQNASKNCRENYAILKVYLFMFAFLSVFHRKFWISPTFKDYLMT